MTFTDPTRPSGPYNNGLGQLPESAGQALDILIGLHLTEDDYDPATLSAWNAHSSPTPGSGIRLGPYGSVHAARGRSGRTELAIPWFPAEGGYATGWVVYTPATSTVHIISDMDELRNR